MKQIVLKNCSECHFLVHGEDEMTMEDDVDWCYKTNEKIYELNEIEEKCPFLTEENVAKIKIEKCSQCPHSLKNSIALESDVTLEEEVFDNSEYIDVCLCAKGLPKILNENVIQDFCPLEDYVE